ncbi:glutaredoxin family protein [Candidatus Saccharibacteria bacterium]|nr:glutaredoxin family protein [Candidatus Saccharibacteria bacterium]
MSSVKVYTTPTCVYCHALLDWFDKLGVEYEEIDASKNPEISSVPVTLIGEEKILGFDRPKIKRALKHLK